MKRRVRWLLAVPALGLVLAAGGVRSDPFEKCNVTGKPSWQCCPKKASPMPPCCQKGCSVR
jgi:hypothetical protein